MDIFDDTDPSQTRRTQFQSGARRARMPFKNWPDPINPFSHVYTHPATRPLLSDFHPLVKGSAYPPRFGISVQAHQQSAHLFGNCRPHITFELCKLRARYDCEPLFTCRHRLQQQTMMTTLAAFRSNITRRDPHDTGLVFDTLH